MPTLLDAPAGTRILSIAEIHVDRPYEPLDHTAKAVHAGLTTSIVSRGLDHPVRVEFKRGRYCLTDGRKRLAACADAGVTRVPAVVEDTP